MNIVDSIEVGRVAHQLALDHGRTACFYAERLAREFEAEGKAAEAAFWQAVWASMRPR